MPTFRLRSHDTLREPVVVKAPTSDAARTAAMTRWYGPFSEQPSWMGDGPDYTGVGLIIEEIKDAQSAQH